MQNTCHIHPSRPLRVLVVDAHEVSRAACSALLRTEGFAVADVAPSDQVSALAYKLEPHVVLVDARSGAEVRSTVEQVRKLPKPPVVLLTSSAEHDRLHPYIARLPFLAKADICAEAILRAVEAATDESPVHAESG